MTVVIVFGKLQQVYEQKYNQLTNFYKYIEIKKTDNQVILISVLVYEHSCHSYKVTALPVEKKKKYINMNDFILISL